jgi:hypothetical protein
MSNATDPIIQFAVRNPDAGPDGNIFVGDTTALPDLFRRLGFEVVEWQRSVTEAE